MPVRSGTYEHRRSNSFPNCNPFCDLSYKEKTKLNNEYSSALEEYCRDHFVGYINANKEIQTELLTSPDRRYLLDHIHPNSTNGVVMYSEAVLKQQ